MSLGPMPKYL